VREVLELHVHHQLEHILVVTVVMSQRHRIVVLVAVEQVDHMARELTVHPLQVT
jgi:hypothetical protein